MTAVAKVPKPSFVELPDFVPAGFRTPCRDVDPELFFPIGGGDTSLAAYRPDAVAREVCRSCPLMDPCADWAAATGQRWGIWGALDPVELAKRRRAWELASWLRPS